MIRQGDMPPPAFYKNKACTPDSARATYRVALGEDMRVDAFQLMMARAQWSRSR